MVLVGKHAHTHTHTHTHTHAHHISYVSIQSKISLCVLFLCVSKRIYDRVMSKVGILLKFMCTSIGSAEMSVYTIYNVLYDNITFCSTEIVDKILYANTCKAGFVEGPHGAGQS